MKVSALVMAGGLGSRMKGVGEKPLIKVAGSTMLSRIVTVLKDVKKLDRVIVACSKYTPKTFLYAKTLPVEAVLTPGDGYVEDTRYTVKKLGLKNVLVAACDLPLIDSQTVARVIDRYFDCGKPALTVMVPVESLRSLGLTPEHEMSVGERIAAPVGLNVLNGARIDDPELEEDVMIIDEAVKLVNVNTVEELRIVKRLALEGLGLSSKELRPQENCKY